MAEQLGEAVLYLRTDDSALGPGIGKAKTEAEGLVGTFQTASSSVVGSLRSAGTAASEMASGAQNAARAATTGARGIAALEGAAKLSRFQVLELAHVSTSLSGALIAGINPVRAFAMEMPRVAEAAALGQGGLLGMASALGALLVPFLPVIAAAGLLATAFLGIKQAAASDAELKQYASTLGLTEKQMGKLKDVTVTWGDTAKATFQVLAEKAGLNADQISKFFTDAFHSIGDFGKFSIAIIIAALATLNRAAYDIFTKLPAIVGEGAVGAANLAISAVEKLINAASGSINRVIDGINSVFDLGLGHIGTVSLPRLQNQFSGTMASIGRDISSTFHGTFNAVESTFDQISARATQVAKDRIKAQADGMKADKDAADATDKHAKSLRDHAKAAKEDADQVKSLAEQLQSLLDKLFPEDAKAREQAAEIDLLNQALAAGIIEWNKYADARARVFGENSAFPVSDDLLKTPPLTEQQKPDMSWTDHVADKVNEATEATRHWQEVLGEVGQIGKNALNQFNDGFAKLLTNSKSLGDFWKGLKGLIHDTAMSALQDLLKLAMKEAEMAALKALFGAFSGGGLVGGFAGGGFVSGPGSGTSDSVPALLSNGEFVMTAEATRKFLPLLEAINNGALRRAAGGTISAPTGSVSYSNDNIGGQNITITNHNDFSGADPQSEARINARLDEMERELPGRIVSTMKEAQDRFVWRSRR